MNKIVTAAALLLMTSTAQAGQCRVDGHLASQKPIIFESNLRGLKDASAETLLQRAAGAACTEVEELGSVIVVRAYWSAVSGPDEGKLVQVIQIISK